MSDQNIATPKANGFAARFIPLVMGTVGAQAIAGLSLIWMGRLFSPESQGQLSLLMVFATLLQAVGLFKMEMLIPKLNQNQGAAFAKRSIALSVPISLITVLILMVTERQQNYSLLTWALVLMSGVGLISTTALSIYANTWNMSRKVSSSKMLQVLVMVVLQTTFGLLGMTSGFYLFLSYAISFMVSSVVLFVAVKDNLSSPMVWPNLWQQGKGFALYIAPLSVINAIGAQAIVPILERNFGVAVSGQLSMANRMLALPSALVMQAVYQAFLSSVDWNNLEGVKSQLSSAIKKLLLFGALVFVPILIWGPEIFALLFGQIWTPAGQLSQALTLGFWMSLVVSPFASIPPMLGKQATSLIIGCIETAVRVGYLQWASQHLNSLQVAWGFGVLGICIPVVYILWVCKLLNTSILTVVGKLGWIAVIFAVLGLCGALVTGAKIWCTLAMAALWLWTLKQSKLWK